MKRLLCLILALGILMSLGACTKRDVPAPTAVPTVNILTPEPTEFPEEATAAETESPEAAEDESSAVEVELWAPVYRSFLEENFDVIAALWPDGISGIGFIDLDLDDMPEMLLFDMGASAAMGVQFFDIVNEQVVCVSSVNEAAAAAFGDEYFSPVSVCAQLFGDFRLVNDGEQTWFRVRSANGTPESSWDEYIRFKAGPEGVLTLESLCRCEMFSDMDNGVIAVENYSVGGESCDEVSYSAALEAAEAASDRNYEAFGVFQWNDMENYDTSLEGLLVMLDDAVAGYGPVAG